jgi:hypothetical protein
MKTLQLRIARTVREYDGQGWHRTGTEVDLESARWLAELVRECGAEPGLEKFALDRVDPMPSYLEVDGRRIEGLPLFDGPFTGAEGVQGRLGHQDADPEVMLVDGPPNLAAETLEKARRSGKHRALVFVTGGIGGEPGLAPRNADRFTEPFGPPVLQVDAAERGWLTDQADSRSPATLVAHAERRTAEAVNVVAEIPGREHDLPPVVVMTPRSGWWYCAAERGGGIVGWLEMMLALHARQPARSVRFVATSGHELGHLGLKSYLQGNPELATGALTWIHLGASIGAARGASPRLFTSDDEMEQLAVRHLEPELRIMPETHPHDAVPAGESRDIHRLGGRYISIAGGHATFHQEADRWPTAVDVTGVAGYATALSNLVLKLAG